MRDIEFRGKKRTTDEKDGEWVFGYYAYILAEDCGCHSQIYVDSYEDNGIQFEDGRSHTVYPETVGQYTGMKDDNGVKIFEGDIIEFNNHGQGYKKSVVDFSVAIGAWWLYDKLLSEKLLEQERSENYKGVVKVIGNIHDNPELCGGKK